MTKTLAEQIVDYQKIFADFSKYEKDLLNWQARPLEDKSLRPSYYGNRWRWDQDWDGLLIERCHKLETAGFTISRFYRKMKIMFKAPKGMTRLEILSKVCEAVGEDWNGITFKKGCSIWWGATNRRWNH